MNLYVRIIVYHAVNHTYETIEKKSVEPCAMTSHTITTANIVKIGAEKEEES